MNHGQLPLIVIEGADGAGTTTQTARLVDMINRTVEVGQPFAFGVRQPTSSPIGRFIRQILTGGEVVESNIARQLLFTADRYEHAQTAILPKLAAGEVVVCDRYSLSTAIYLAASEPRYVCHRFGCTWTGDEHSIAPGFAKLMTPPPAPERLHEHEADNREVELLKMAFTWNRWAPMPLLTIVLDVLPEVAEERRALRGGKPELFEQVAFQRRVCQLYSNSRSVLLNGDFFDESSRAGNPLLEPVVIVNGNQDENTVAEEVFRLTEHALTRLEERRRMLADT